MRVIKDAKGKDIITMADPPSVREERLQAGLISTNNIEEIKKKQKKDEEAAKAKEEAQHEAGK